MKNTHNNLPLVDNHGEKIFKEPMVFEESTQFTTELPRFSICTFEQNLTIVDTKRPYSFIRCTFKGNISLPPDISNIHFENCTFSRIDNRINLKGGKVTLLELTDKKISDKYYINTNSNNNESCTIEKLVIKNVFFKENVKFHSCKIDELTFEGNDFEKNVDFSKCKFGSDKKDSKISFQGNTFNDMLFLNEAIFYNTVIFERVTFGGESNFQNSDFKKGLKLDNTISKKILNFSGVKGLESKESKQCTSRETYRIIKYHFNKLNNKIEANKFAALELDAHRKLLGAEYINFKKNTINYQLGFWEKFKEYIKYCMDKTILSIHKISSNFGTNWLMPLFWILVVGIVYTLIFCSSKMDEHIFDILLNLATFDKDAWSEVFEFASIYTHIDIEKQFFQDNPGYFLVHKMSLGYLYYQFITAVRKDTRK